MVAPLSKVSKKSKSINRRVRKDFSQRTHPPSPPRGGFMFCNLMKFLLNNSFSPPLGGQPRSGRGCAYLACFAVKKDFSTKLTNLILLE